MRRSKWKLFRLFLFSIILLFLIFVIVKVLNARQWDGNTRISLAIYSDPPTIFSLDPRLKRAFIISYPSNTLLEVPFGYKTYTASSIFKLGELDKERGGGKLLAKTVENTFGIYINGFVSLDYAPIAMGTINSQRISQLKSNYFSLSGSLVSIIDMIQFLSKVNTNLSLIDLYGVWAQVRAIRSDRIEFIDLESAQVLVDDLLADKTAVKRIDFDQLDLVVTNRFQDQMMRSESVTLEVSNASGRDRLASQFARILRLRGANVIIKSTDQSIQKDNCILYLSQASFRNALITQFLTHAYDCSIRDGNTDQMKANIKIVVGEQFYQ